MSFNAEWTNADALSFKPYTAYESVSVTYSATTTDLIGDLLCENAKLRELVQELYEDQCAECDIWRYLDRMRELGIEVDG